METSATESSAVSSDEIMEPYVGMEFDSEEAAKLFYDNYARQMGFFMRVMSCHRSEVDGRMLARQVGCNKEGYFVSICSNISQARKPRESTGGGCKAMILVKLDKSGKWTVTKFTWDHNHPLVISPREARQTLDDKDKKIQELTVELRNKKRLCSMYEEQLIAFVKVVEELNIQLSQKVQVVLNNLKEVEINKSEPSALR